jgi:hypothetical protein
VAIDRAGIDPCYARHLCPDTRTAGHCETFRTSMPPLFRPTFTPSMSGKATGHVRRGTMRRTPRRNGVGGRISPRDL